MQAPKCGSGHGVVIAGIAEIPKTQHVLVHEVTEKSVVLPGPATHGEVKGPAQPVDNAMIDRRSGIAKTLRVAACKSWEKKMSGGTVGRA